MCAASLSSCYELSTLQYSCLSVRLVLMDKHVEERLAALERELKEARSGAASQGRPIRLQPLRNSRFVIRSLSLFCVLALLSIAGWYAHAQHSRSQIQNKLPAAIRNQAAFPVYLPDNLGYEIDTDSVSLTDGMLTFIIKLEDNTVVLTEQRLPDKMDLNNFFAGEGIKNARQVPHKEGQFLVGKIKNKNTGIIATETGALLIATTDATPDQVSISTLLDDIVRIN